MRGHPFIPIRAGLRWLSLAGASCLAMAAFSGCSKEKAETPVILANVGERAITAADFVAEVERRMATMRPLSDRESVLAEMIEREALLQRATELGLREDPEVQRELENILIGKLRSRELSPLQDSIEVSDQDLLKAYQENVSKYTRGAKVRLAIIKIETRPTMSVDRQAEAYRRLQEARAKALAMDRSTHGGTTTAGFGNLALDYSEDQLTRYRGGDLGWLDPSLLTYRCPSEVLETGYAMAQGEISDPIKTADGYYLVMKTDTREARVTPFESVAPSLRPSVASAKRREVAEKFSADALLEAGVEIDHQALAGVRLSPMARRLMAPRDELHPPAVPGVNLSADAD